MHEWGHLRWGLFDEYPITGDITEHFYISPTTNNIQPTRCNINVVGELINEATQVACNIDPATSLPEANCRFIPDSARTQALASFMYRQELPSVGLHYFLLSIVIIIISFVTAIAGTVA